MAEIVGIRFRRAGKIYYFAPSGVELEANDYAIVKTSRGQELGHVVIAPVQIEDSEVTEPLRAVVRKAAPEDIARAEELEANAEAALVECGQLIGELQLSMKLITADFNLDGSRLTILFSAEERVDFRELVKRLNSRLKVRVELRQVGSRDEAKLIGGCGRCGRQLCCSSFLSEFSPVSIRMAKEQDLSLNPMKISGACGRLMCCLGYESEQYRAAKAKMPKVGQRVSTPSGEATVSGLNPMTETVQVELEGGETAELPLSDVSRKQRAGK
ncbi:stage 0 sporulation family protein [Chloroflexota bacterium]